MAKTHIYIALFLCILALGQKLVSSETCDLQLGCSEADFDCWYDCKHKYHGFGHCTNKDTVLSRPAFLPSDEDGGNGGDGGQCCQCHCKFESTGACPNPNSADPPSVSNK